MTFPESAALANLAHTKRNLAEYEGDLDVTQGFVEELVDATDALIGAAQALQIST